LPVRSFQPGFPGVIDFEWVHARCKWMLRLWRHRCYKRVGPPENGVSIVTLPATFDPCNAIVTPHGASLALDSLLRPAGQNARGVLLMVDLVRNRLTSTKESVEPTVGALGVVVR
jgi:hypothetical protein